MISKKDNRNIALAKKGKDICNLECKKPKKKTKEEKEAEEVKKEVYPQIHEFNGPVRLVVVDPPDDADTACKTTAAGFIAKANLAIGINFVVYIIYSMSFVYSFGINAHMFLCTLGFQFLLPLSILIHNPLFGASGPLSDTARTWAHCKFIVLILICTCCGVEIGYIELAKPKGLLARLAADQLPFNKLHRTFGKTAMYFFIPSTLTGIALVVLTKTKLGRNVLPKVVTIVSIFHTVTGFITLVMSNVCYALSLFSPLFQIYMYFSANLVPTLIMIVTVVFYTVILMIIRGSSFKD